MSEPRRRRVMRTLMAALSPIAWGALNACAAPPAGSPAADVPALGGVTWRLTELVGGPVAPATAEAATLRFDAVTQRVTGSSGVNRMAGPYRLQGEQLTLGPLAGTRMAGPPEAMAFEDRVLGMLGRVTGARLERGRLLLVDAAGQVVARYDAAR